MSGTQLLGALGIPNTLDRYNQQDLAQIDEFNLNKPPKATHNDLEHTLGKAVISTIPGIGGFAAEFFSYYITPPLAKRQAKWLEQVYNNLILLAEKVENVTLEKLVQNEIFLTTLMQATPVAISTHQKEKLEALRNAVLNSSLPYAPEEDIQLMFLNWIEGWSASHLNLLNFIKNPQDWCCKNSINLKKNWNYKSTSKNGGFYPPGHLEVLELIFPGIKQNLDFYNQVLQELMDKNLVTRGIRATMAQVDLQGSFFSLQNMGALFLEFITFPLDR